MSVLLTRPLVPRSVHRRPWRWGSTINLMMDSRCSRRFQLPADRFQSSGIFFCAARTPVDPSEKRGLPPISFRLKIFRFFLCSNRSDPDPSCSRHFSVYSVNIFLNKKPNKMQRDETSRRALQRSLTPTSRLAVTYGSFTGLFVSTSLKRWNALIPVVNRAISRLVV